VNEDVRNILRQHHISITRARLAMLQVFLRTNGALTYDNFLNHPSLQLNRVTIYRVLNLFADKNIIHRVPATDNINRYLMQQASAIVHSNFMCTKCKRIIPLETIVSPKVKLPKDFMQQNVEIIIGGLCASCNK
jgi:Fur family transcriptional regulator, ferric uptake regulator